MAAGSVKQEVLEKFHNEIDTLVQEIVERFDWMGLPEGDQREELMVELSDAVSDVLRFWL